MKSNIHYKFITTPISEILEEAVSACKGIGNGIETQPLCEYIMQTTFLKMTGASEQKLKCICWEMATYDFEYRYQKLQNPLGECSSYKDKKIIFDEMKTVIERVNPSLDYNVVFSTQVKNSIIKKIQKDLISLIEKSVLSQWDIKKFIFFKSNLKNMKPSLFLNLNTKKTKKNKENNKNKNKESEKNNLSFLEEELKNYYENIVYKHRNRCAHNLKSYQENLPSLKKLQSKDYDNENYFQMFFVLMLMDEIYMLMYKKYVQLLNENIF